MRTEHLEEFIAFIRAGSISTASEKLQVPQSNLSRHLSDIEKEVGVELFFRDSKYRLTPAGLAFFNGAIQILHCVEALKKKCSEVTNSPQVPLSVQETPIRVPNFYDKHCQILLELGRKFPEINIENKTVPVSNPIDALFNKLVDVAQIPVLADSEADKKVNNSQKLDSYHIASDTLAVWIDKNHLLAQRDSISIDDLVDIPIAATINYLTKSFESIILDLFKANGKTPLFKYIEADSFTDFLLDCGANNGICLLPSSAEQDVRITVWSNTRVMRPIAEKHGAAINYYLVLAADNKFPGAQMLREVLAQQR